MSRLTSFFNIFDIIDQRKKIFTIILLFTSEQAPPKEKASRTKFIGSAEAFRDAAIIKSIEAFKTVADVFETKARGS